MTRGRLRRGRSTAQTTVALAPALLVVLLLCSFQSASADVQTTSGTTATIGNTLNHGATSYAVLYSYPSVADVGSNLTIQLTLHINQFSGIVEYIVGYALKVEVFVGPNVLSDQVFGPAGFNASSFLYPGAYWGPNNLTIPLTAANTGLAEGQSDNATLRITLRDTVYYGVPVIGYQTEPALEASGGSLLIQNGVASSTTSTSGGSAPAGGQSVIPYALLAAGAVLMVAAVFVPRGPRQPKPGQ